MSDDDSGVELPRRAMLSATAGAAASALAGCGALKPSDPSEGERPDDADQYKDAAFTGPINPETGILPNRVRFNPYNPMTSFRTDLIYDQLTVYDHVNREYLPQVAEDWTVGEETATINLNPDYKWSDGKDLVAKDIDLYFSLLDAIGGLVTENYIEDWTVVDDHTIEITRKNPGANPELFRQNVLTQRPDTPRQLWEDHIEDIVEASGDAQDAAIEEAVTMTIKTGDAVVSGPYVPNEAEGKKRLIYWRNDEHPMADQIGAPIMDFKVVGGRFRANEPANALKEGVIDFYPDNPFEQSVRADFPEHIKHVNTQGLAGGEIYLNHEGNYFGDRNLRQAMRLAIDMDKATAASNTRAPPSRVTGMVNEDINETWLGDAWDSYTDYDGKQTEKAAELMREAGYERPNKFWKDSSGEVIQFDIPLQIKWTDAIAVTRVIASQLQEFGIKAGHLAIEFGTFDQKHWQGGKFDAIFYSFGLTTPTMWYPWYYHHAHFASENAKKKTRANHTYEVPATIGDPDSSTESVDPAALVRELEQATDRETATQLIRRLSWVYNQTVPSILPEGGYSTSWYATENWNIPTIEDPSDPPEAYKVFDSKGMLMRGQITPKK